MAAGGVKLPPPQTFVEDGETLENYLCEGGLKGTRAREARAGRARAKPGEAARARACLASADDPRHP